MTSGEKLTTWELDIYQPSAKGKGSGLAYTIKLTNANITSIVTTTDDQGGIRETWAKGGITAMDNWK